MAGQALSEPAPIVKVTGTLASDAVMRFTAGGVASVQYEIVQPDSRPLMAEELVGADPLRIYAVRSRLQLLRAGDRITVHAQHLCPKRGKHGFEVHLQGVREVIPHTQYQRAAPAREAG